MQTGYVFKDGRPIPDDELEKSSRAGNIAALPANPSNRSGLSTTEAPTMSHALAEADHDEKGSAQIEHFEGEVKDLGWNEPGNIVQPLVGGLQNADLWLLLRRFNKQVSHVKATAMVPLGGLDLSTADSVQEEISPDKLQVLLERLYMTVVIGLVGFVKHIVRLRSWREPRRTSAFAAVGALNYLCLTNISGLLSRVDAQSGGPSTCGYKHCSHRLPTCSIVLVSAGTACSGQLQNRRYPVSTSRNVGQS